MLNKFACKPRDEAEIVFSSFNISITCVRISGKLQIAAFNIQARTPLMQDQWWLPKCAAGDCMLIQHSARCLNKSVSARSKKAFS